MSGVVRLLGVGSQRLWEGAMGPQVDLWLDVAGSPLLALDGLPDGLPNMAGDYAALLPLIFISTH